MKLAHCGSTILLAGLCAAFMPAGSTRAAVGRQSSTSAESGQAQAGQEAHGAGSAPARNAQTQADPLAAAARRAREKQKDHPKPAKVWDNDNIPTAGDVDVVGPSVNGSAPAAHSAADENAGQGSAQSTESSGTSDLEAQLKAAKDDLKSLQTSLDFAQRKFALDQQSYYQNPGYASDTAGAKALKDEQSQIDANKQQVDAAQKKVDALEAKAQSAGQAKDSTSSGNSGATGSSDGGSAQ